MQTGIGVTGVMGVLRNGDDPTVLARADADDPAVTARVTSASAEHFGDGAIAIPSQSASEDRDPRRREHVRR